MNSKLNLSQDQINQARKYAKSIADDTQRFIDRHTTVATERAICRLLGIDGVDDVQVPLPNVVVDHLVQYDLLGAGASLMMGNAMSQLKITPREIAEKISTGELNLSALPMADVADIHRAVNDIAQEAVNAIAANRQVRADKLSRHGDKTDPFIYVIVATGNIYEDITQAVAAVRQGADIIAVIRTTGQSLLDYVPYGATTEGFGGTYATQENFRLMREALDAAGDEAGRYIRLCNYCSGLCMPEIAAMGALERLDVMLNDALYGILFRDINMQRTLVDQFFSRVINGFAGIVINTGEDNYLTTDDAVEQAHTVLTSQFLNEQLAIAAGIPEQQMGLGHAFEISPDVHNGFLMELAQAQMAREIFPNAPLKYMPPTKFMTGDIFRGTAQNTLFNTVSIITGQKIHLLGMLTEAIHTPFMSDRALAIDNARYVFNTMADLGDELEFKPGGIMQTRAAHVLDKACELLAQIEKNKLFATLEQGIFAGIKRGRDDGRGLSGVTLKADGYFNPFIELMSNTPDIGPINLPPTTAPITKNSEFRIQNSELIKPYGDTLNDGKIQLSFTLPIPNDDRGREAAKITAQKMGLESINVAHSAALDDGFTFYVVYGSMAASVDYGAITVAAATDEVMNMDEVSAYIRENIRRKLVIIGASTGTDAHTVGIDAIMNMKGFAGNYGLERYDMIEAHNLGSQVANEDFIARAKELNADVLLVSQTVTQKDIHITNMTELTEMLEAEGLREKVVLICGGPRISNELAKELGYDAGFGQNSFAQHVATFAAQEFVRRGLK